LRIFGERFRGTCAGVLGTRRLFEQFNGRPRIGGGEILVRSEIDVLTPTKIEEALDLLHQHQTALKIIAGGSDIIVQLKDGIIKTNSLLNILSLKELRYVKRIGNEIHVGALSTYSDINNSPLIIDHAWILRDAAKQIGAVQLQNTATIGGNLGNASPAGDTLPPLYALDATVVTRSRSSRRSIPIREFFTGYRKTALKPDELIEEIHFSAMESGDTGAYLKLGLREANAISIVDVAAVLLRKLGEYKFADARVALGAVAPTIVRAHKCEAALINRSLTEGDLWAASRLAAEEAAPISDIRASAEYRRNVTVSCVFQALHQALFGRVNSHD
jgi:xanthine dehydrogenase FAD-binding subunit